MQITNQTISIKGILPGLILNVFLSCGFSPLVSGQPSPPNILFIAIDDLKPILGCYGDTLVKTPNIDALAEKGILFTHNYCQQAVCAPSRASLLTSRYPDQTRVWDLQTQIRDMEPNTVTLPQYLRDKGYQTAGTGKIFDQRSVDSDHDLPSWSIPFRNPWPAKYYNPETGKPVAYFYASQDAKDTVAILEQEATELGVDKMTYIFEHYKPSVEWADVPYDAYTDGAIANVGIELMEQVAGSAQPFFLAVGFHRPHLPFNAPRQFWDQYSREDFRLAEFQDKASGSPDLAYHNFYELRDYTDIPGSGDPSVGKQLELIHGYYAATSYIDHLIGMLIGKLKELGLEDNTAIVLWGDHGWHLGDHKLWCKHSNFEQATRSPLIISYPGQQNQGSTCAAPVEFTDVAPTLCEIAGIDIPPYFEGESLMPLFNDPDSSVRKAALSQYPRNNYMGYSLRTERYRYTKWVDKNNGNTHSTELYDYETDPLETVSYSSDPAYQQVKFRLDSMLDERITVPSTQEKIIFRVRGMDKLGDTVDLEQASILIGGYELVNNNTGEALLTHHPDTIEYRIDAKGYQSRTGTIIVTNDTLLNFFMELKVYNVNVTVRESWHDEPIPGASVDFDDRNYQTDSTGSFNFPEEGYVVYHFNIMHPDGYGKDFSNIELFSDTVLVFYLDPPTFEVGIRLIDLYTGYRLAGASVTLNNVTENTTPAGEVAFTEIKGSYLLNIDCIRHAHISDSIHLSSDTLLVYRLEPTLSDVIFQLKDNETPLSMATISIADNQVISNDQGMALFPDLPTKVSYHYDIERAGYISIEDSFYLMMDTSFVVRMEKINTSAPASMYDEFLLWPNPASDVIHVSFASREWGYWVQIVDIMGNIVREIYLPGRDTHEININDLLEGSYWVRLISGDHSYGKRFVKQRHWRF